MNEQLPAGYREGYEEAITSMMVATSPLSTAYMFYAYLAVQCTVEFTTKVQMAGVKFDVDHYVLAINPISFNSLPIEHRCGIIKHEMLHILNGHMLRLEERENFTKWNYATDCAINQLTERSHLPNGAIYPDNLPVKSGCKAEPKLASESYYDIIDDSKLPQDPQSQSGDGDGDGEGQSSGNPGPMDDHSTWKESRGANDDLQKDITSGMMEKSVNSTQKSRGDMPSQLSDWLELNSNKREVNWRQVLRGICGNKRVNTRRTLMRLDRRFSKREDIKGKTKDRMFSLLLVGDESGSVSSQELLEAITEVKNICDVTKSDLDYIAIDTQPHAPTKIKKGQTTFKRQACGGTTLHPALDMAKKHKLDFQAVVVITDGGLCSSDVQKFAELGKKVIWLITSHGHIMPEMETRNMKAYKLGSK